MIFLHGYLLGLGTIIFIGPVVFTLLQATLEKGVKAGISTALGIIISDIAAVSICAIGAIRFLEDVENMFWIAIIGAVLLCALGLKYIIAPDVKSSLSSSSIKGSDYSKYFAKGFLINFLNPSVFIYWIGFITYAKIEYQSSFDMWVFIGAMLLGIFSIDTAKTLLAGKIKPYIGSSSLRRVYQGIGIVLVIFAIIMVCTTVKQT